MQMAEHKKLVDQRKRGAPGSKEAEVFHLQEAMEERNERNVRSKEENWVVDVWLKHSRRNDVLRGRVGGARLWFAR